MKIKKNCMKMKERGKGIYLDQTWRDSVKRCSQNLLLKFWAQIHYVGYKFQMIWEILNFLPFIDIFWNFYPLYIVFDHFGPFELSWCCRSPFWVWFDRGFDPFMPTASIMSKLAYRLSFTYVCILHNLMTVSF